MAGAVGGGDVFHAVMVKCECIDDAFAEDDFSCVSWSKDLGVEDPLLFFG